MTQLRPVIWSKGTLLTPQHLQLQDRFIESVLGFHLDALSFRPWGFRELQINRESLQKGVFAVSRASGIFPDGLLFSMPDSDDLPESLQIQLDKHQESTDVYLTIPQFHESGMNVSLQAQDGQGRRAAESETRFRSEWRVFRDETSAASERRISIARKNFRLITAAVEGHVAMRIARVRRGAAANSLELDPQFVPPLIDISASPYLETIVKNFLEIMSAKSANLSRMRRQRNENVVEFSSSDIMNYWLLYTVNTYLPLLRHISETTKGHPSHLFDTMLAMAGGLTTFSSRLQPKDFPLYDHEDLGTCFRTLEEFIRKLLEGGRPPWDSLPLKVAKPSVHATALAEEKYFHNAQMYLAVSADMPEADLINGIKTFKVSSADRVEELMSLAVGGIRLTHTPKPAVIPINIKYQYFIVDQTGPDWDSVRRARNFAVYVPRDFRNPQLELWIIVPQNE
jgi:type VI secretion system protein ImpJ